MNDKRDHFVKNFVNEYKEVVFRFSDAVQVLIQNDDKVSAEFSTKNIHPIDFAKELVSQITFMYFLQLKGWFCVQNNQDFGDGDKNFLETLFKIKEKSENYFNDYLKYLLYDTLNVKRDNDYSKRFKGRFPFLNSDLFNPACSYNWYNVDLYLPDKLFYGTENSLLNVFGRYKFSLNEDSFNIDVVDPEVLSKVFEYMLGIKERKSKGAFYTPKEIVRYMVQESIINHLDTSVDVSKSDLEKLIKLGEVSDSIKRHADEIDQSLADIRVCDPAVGSGAFLIGMVDELVKSRQTLSDFVTDKKDRSRYALKYHCLKYNLYGVDIDTNAIKICQLRLWLSLIVDG